MYGTAQRITRAPGRPGAAGPAYTAFTAGLHLALLAAAGIVLAAAVAVAAPLRGHGRTAV